MTHASLKYAQLLTQGEIFQGDLFMPTKYQRDGPKNDQDCVQHSGPKCVGFVDENQPYETDGFWRGTPKKAVAMDQKGWARRAPSNLLSRDHRIKIRHGHGCEGMLRPTRQTLG